MRHVILDTETTGLEPSEGHRIIEIGCLELVHRRPSGRRFHRYLNPDRPVDAGAVEVHGLDDRFLADKPRFHEVVDEFLDFIRGAELVIHNAPFDVGFLNAELARLGPQWGAVEDYAGVTDTLAQARTLHPGQRNSLDALCKRYQVDNSGRELHGALLDAELLAEVYLAMTGGQGSLGLDPRGGGSGPGGETEGPRPLPADRPPLVVPAPSPEELVAHQAWVERLDESLGGPCAWHALEGSSEGGS